MKFNFDEMFLEILPSLQCNVSDAKQIIKLAFDYLVLLTRVRMKTAEKEAINIVQEPFVSAFRGRKICSTGKLLKLLGACR